jgi:hypothetical protein
MYNMPAPSTVNTSTIVNAVGCPYQDKSFKAAGRYWVFYSDGTNMVYRTSTDGINWSSATTIRACDHGEKFSVYFDGTYLHYVYASDVLNETLKYRRGTPNSDGSITWSTTTELDAVAANSAKRYSRPTVTADAGGYPWVAYTEYYSGYGTFPVLTRSSTNDGTWSTSSGYPTYITTVSEVGWRAKVVALSVANRVIVLYTAGEFLLSRLRDAGAWYTPETAIDYAVFDNVCFDGYADGDDVYAVVTTQPPAYEIWFNKRTWGVGWGTAENVQTDIPWGPAVLARRTSTGEVYCFWTWSTSVYYKVRSTAGVWGSVTTLFTGEAAFTSLGYSKTGWEKDVDNEIGLVWETGTSSPYNVRFGLWTPVVVKKPIMKMDLGPHPRSRLLFAPTLILKGAGSASSSSSPPPDPWEGWFMDEV